MPQLRPALPPPAVRTDAILARGIVAMVGSAAVAGLLAYMHLWLPFVSRTRGPFARACREIRKVLRRERTDVAYAAALSEVHRAFNATARRVVFEHELERFFREHAHFAGLRQPIAEMFQASTTVFYRRGSDSITPASARERVLALLQLCEACRDRERGLA